MDYYLVAKTKEAGFVGQLTQEEIARQFHAGELLGDYVATKSVGLSYRQLMKSGASNWITVADLVAHLPVQNARVASESVRNSVHTSPSGSIVGGILCALVGLFIYLWASRHSPYNPFGAMMTGGLENYVLKEPFYTVILLVAAGLGLLGISLLVLGLISRAKLS